MFHLHSLRITGAGYKLLRDGAELRINDWRKPVAVLIGDNGSGKSTVIECLTWIFRALHERYVMERRSVQPPFEFELIYYVTESERFADFEEREKFSLAVTKETEVRASGKLVDGKYELTILKPGFRSIRGETKRTWISPAKADFTPLIPDLVVYYSGLSERIEDIYKAFEATYRASLLHDGRSSQDAFTRLRTLPLYYHERGHFELLLAALYSFEEYHALDEFLTGRLQMHKPAADCLHLTIRRKEYPGKTKATAANFWNADGELGIFLARLREYAARETAQSDQSLTFAFDLQGWYDLRATYGEERLLLTLLLLIQAEGLLQRLEVFYDLLGQPHVSHLAMSEGQQQIITLRALNELMVGDNTLFLFDEPDTYLHPKWQAEFMKEIQPFGERASFLITTHSPLLLANFKDGNLFSMTDGRATFIKGHYYGRTYGDTIRDVLGTDEDRAPEVEEKFLHLFDLLDRSAWDEADDELAELRRMVGPDDLELVQAETMLHMMRPEETGPPASNSPKSAK